jgi:hypothetical protein
MIPKSCRLFGQDFAPKAWSRKSLPLRGRGLQTFPTRSCGRTNAWSEMTIQFGAISLCSIPTANLPNGCTSLIRVRSISAVVAKIPAAGGHATEPGFVRKHRGNARCARIALHVQGPAVTASDGPLLEEVDLFREGPDLFPRNESTPNGFRDAFVVGWLTTPCGAADDTPFGDAATNPAVPPTSRSVPKERIDTGPKAMMGSLSAG